LQCDPGKAGLLGALDSGLSGILKLRRDVSSWPFVWTGRALQAENNDLEKVGLALLYPAY